MYCIKEPDQFCGGETVLLKNSDLTAMLDPKVTQEMEEKKIRYQAFLPNKDSKAKLQKSWQDRFWMDDPKVCLFCICSFFLHSVAFSAMTVEYNHSKKRVLNSGSVIPRKPLLEEGSKESSSDMYGTISLIASMDVKGVFVSELMFILMMEMGDSKQLEPLLY